jgi:hypothetical protein
LFPSWFTGFAFAAIAIGALVPAAVMSSGCGTVVPEIQELPGSPNDGDLLVKEIVRRVHCEVQDAVQYVILTDERLAAQGLNGGERLTEWLDTCGAQVQLNLTIVESTSLNPGVTLIHL